jgi:DHA1 family tetracycline resistance protein-like MFS transporter
VSAGQPGVPKKAGLGFIVVTLFLDILGIGLIAPVLPRLLELFVGHDATAASRTFGLLSASFALMQFIFSPILGSLSDRVGRRPVLLISLVGSGLNYLLLAFAPTLAWFFLARIVAGITAASIGTAGAYIADVSPPEKRAQNFGLIGMSFGLGFVAGPTIAAIAGQYDVRLPFYLAAGLSLVNAVYGFFVLPESLAPDHRRPFSWARANPIGTLNSLRKYSAVYGLSVAVFFIMLAQRGLESVWVLYTEHRYQWTIRQTGLSLAMVGLSAAIVQGGLVRRVIPALGERRSIIVGALIGSVSFMLYGLANQGWMLYAILPLGALGGISGPAAQGLMSKAVPASEQGMLQGGLSSMQSVTNVIGPLLSTWLFGLFIGPSAPAAVPGISFFVGAGLMLVGLALAARTFSKLPAHAPPAG